MSCPNLREIDVLDRVTLTAIDALEAHHLEVKRNPSWTRTASILFKHLELVLGVSAASRVSGRVGAAVFEAIDRIDYDGYYHDHGLHQFAATPHETEVLVIWQRWRRWAWQPQSRRPQWFTSAPPTMPATTVWERLMESRDEEEEARRRADAACREIAFQKARKERDELRAQKRAQDRQATRTAFLRAVEGSAVAALNPPPEGLYPDVLHILPAVADAELRLHPYYNGRRLRRNERIEIAERIIVAHGRDVALEMIGSLA